MIRYLLRLFRRQRTASRVNIAMGYDSGITYSCDRHGPLNTLICWKCYEENRHD